MGRASDCTQSFQCPPGACGRTAWHLALCSEPPRPRLQARVAWHQQVGPKVSHAHMVVAGRDSGGGAAGSSGAVPIGRCAPGGGAPQGLAGQATYLLGMQVANAPGPARPRPALLPTPCTGPASGGAQPDPELRGSSWRRAAQRRCAAERKGGRAGAWARHGASDWQRVSPFLPRQIPAVQACARAAWAACCWVQCCVGCLLLGRMLGAAAPVYHHHLQCCAFAALPWT